VNVCTCEYMCVHIYEYIEADHIYHSCLSHICGYIVQACMYTYMCLWVCMYMDMCLREYVENMWTAAAGVQACMYVCLYVFMGMYVYGYVSTRICGQLPQADHTYHGCLSHICGHNVPVCIEMHVYMYVHTCTCG